MKQKPDMDTRQGSIKMDALVSSQVRNLESGNSKVTFVQSLNKKKKKNSFSHTDKNNMMPFYHVLF